MKRETKVFESKAVIRFPDCDPFNHLNNGRYIDYFINAREDHLMKYLGFNLYQLAKEKGTTWVVSKNQIAYMRPALLMETVVIQSTIIKWNEKNLRVEMRMWNSNKTVLKALLWSDFTHFNLLTQRSITHEEEINQRFLPFENQIPVEFSAFDERVEFLKNKTAIELDHPFSHYVPPQQRILAVAV